MRQGNHSNVPQTIACSGRIIMLLPTVSEGDIDFTIPKPKNRGRSPRPAGCGIVKSMSPEQMVGNFIILQFTK